MKIDINIDTQLNEIFEQIGLSQEEIDKEYDKLNERIQDLFWQVLKEYVERRKLYEKEAKEAEAKLKATFRNSGFNQSYQIDSSLPFRQRIESANSQLTQYEKQVESQKREYKIIYDLLTTSFDVLEIDERGDFETEGTNYSQDKIDRMTELLTAMKEVIERRKPEMEQLLGDINQLRENLGLEQEEIPTTLGDETFSNMKKNRERLQQQLDSNTGTRDAYLKEIRTIERVLNAENKEFDESEQCPDSLVEEMKQYIEELRVEKERRLPQFIEDAKRRIQELWDELHIPSPSPDRFPFYYAETPSKRTLAGLESEILRLENLSQHAQEMLALCAQRDAILQETQRLRSLERHPNRLTSRKTEMATALIEEEKSRKLCTVNLPKINRKLKPMLIDYQQTFGEPFLWDGRVLLDEVTEELRRDEESHSYMDSRQARRKTPSTSKIMKSPYKSATMSPRTPK